MKDKSLLVNVFDKESHAGSTLTRRQTMHTPRTTSARRKSHCDHLPLYVVDVNICEQIERDLIDVRNELAASKELHMIVIRKMRWQIMSLEKKRDLTR